MYTNYSLVDVHRLCVQKSGSVLDQLPDINGPQLVTSLIRPLVTLVSQQQSSSAGASISSGPLKECLQEDKDVLWIMEVIGYGLSLHFYEKDQIDAIRDCVNLYYEWFHALSPSQATNKFIPLPIQRDPNLYCQKIIGHLYNIFRPRRYTAADNLSDLSSKQAIFCHRILRLIINIASDRDNRMNAATWECLLVFLLGINEELLRSQNQSEDIGTQIAERVISTLFEGWLLACASCFPSPSYWKTFQSICANLRHRPALIIQWNRVNVCLTNALVGLLYSGHTELHNHHSSLSLGNRQHFAQYNAIVLRLNGDALKQCWYRFLHIIGNPIELCFPEIVFKVDLQSQPLDQATLNLLPFIFHKAIKGLCFLVDIFLGIPTINLDELDYEIPKFQYGSNTLQTQQHQQQQQHSSTGTVTPPDKRRSNFALYNKQQEKQSQSSKTSGNQPNSHNSPRLSGQQQQQQQQQQHHHQQQQQHHQQQIQQQKPDYILPYFVLRSLPGNIFRQNQVKSTSVLDIFGKWLFQASLICSSNSAVLSVFQDTISEHDVAIDSLRKSFSKSDKLSEAQLTPLPLKNFEAGQAEAIGALCRIFCFKKSDEDISFIISKQGHAHSQKIKHYLTSYYLAMKFGLSSSNENFQIQPLSSILVNSVWFFEVDLPGSKILVPHFLKSIEIFLTKKDKSNDVLIRRACIKILTSLLPYPLHFKDLPIKDTLSETPSNTFMSLFPRLVLLLIHGLHNEPDSVNVQMILGALLFIIEDSVKYDDLFLGGDSFGGESGDGVDPLMSSLMQCFKNDYEGSDKPDTVPCNVFLLIISFVAEILCKSSNSRNSTDYNVSLSALEVLSALGRTHYRRQLLCDGRCLPCIKQIFTFIENQCYKPAMFHSKDMHSTIVAAYQCLSVWIHEHCHLLRDRECIVLLFELIELGISGTKSKTTAAAGGAATTTFKSEKQAKPTSMRVKEAAEFLLSTLMGRINLGGSGGCSIATFDPSTSAILSCDLSEPKIIESMLNLRPSQFPSNHFRYFIADNSLLISILERPLLNEETLVIIRSPYGKYCWLLKYQHLSGRQQLNCSQSGGDSTSYRSLPKLVDQQPNQKGSAPCSYFPEFFDKICTSKFDNTVLKLSEYISEQAEIKQEHDVMQNLIDKIESNLKFEKSKLTLNTNKNKEFSEPPPAKSFEASRLILSQFKAFNFDVVDDGRQTLMALNENSKEFIDYLEKLDMISTKNNDIVVVLHIPKGFADEADIFQANLKQFSRTTASSPFKEFMCSLGNVIDCNTNTAIANLLYWNDISHELLFINPTNGNSKQQPLTLTDLVREDNESLRRVLLQANQSDNCANHRTKSYLMNNVGCDIKLMVLWLESMEDFDRLPFHQLASESESAREQLYFIVINPLRNGLFKVVPHSFGGKSTSISPTIERMLLSKHLLATYVRLTALNLFRRRRMNTESFQLPHVKRRIKIAEITSRFKMPYSNKQLISDLFATNKFSL